jgi:hypothetical protein
MTDTSRNQAPGPRAVVNFPQTNRNRRAYIPPVLLHILVALMGLLVAAASSYALRSFGD